MTTITIRDSEELSRRVFKNIGELQDYLTLLFQDKDFSDSFKTELDSRENDILSGKEKGIPWDKVRAKLSDLRH